MKDSFFNILKNKIKSLKSSEEYGSLYKWGFFYIIMTYLYPILYCITIPNYRDVADWDIIGQTINDLQNSEIGRRIPLIFLAVPIILLIGSIVTVLKSKCTDRKQNAGHKLGIGGKSRKYIIYRCHYKSCYCHKSW